MPRNCCCGSCATACRGTGPLRDKLHVRTTTGVAGPGGTFGSGYPWWWFMGAQAGGVFSNYFQAGLFEINRNATVTNPLTGAPLNTPSANSWVGLARNQAFPSYDTYVLLSLACVATLAFPRSWVFSARVLDLNPPQTVGFLLCQTGTELPSTQNYLGTQFVTCEPPNITPGSYYGQIANTPPPGGQPGWVTGLIFKVQA